MFPITKTLLTMSQNVEDEVRKAARGLTFLFHLPKMALAKEMGWFITHSKGRGWLPIDVGMFSGAVSTVLEVGRLGVELL